MLLDALPFQLIHLPAALIIKRGCTEVSVEGENAALVVQLLLDRLAGGPATREELAAIFPPADRPAIVDLVDYLHDRRLLIDHEAALFAVAEDGPPSPGGPDIFFWHFGLTPRRAGETMKRQAIVVVGVNRVARSLVRTLIEAGVDNLRLVDYAPLRNLQLVDGLSPADRWPDDFPAVQPFAPDDPAAAFRGAGCIVAASDFGGWHLLDRWNRQSVERGLHFLPVMLENLIGWIGPLVVPGRTACLACLRARLDSNLPNPGLRRVIDGAAEAGKAVQGGHPAIADLVGILAATELLKFYNSMPGWQVNQVIEVNLLAARMTPRRVLRIPRCPVCSALNRHATPDPLRRAPLVTAARAPA